jgi:hypothetical protein
LFTKIFSLLKGGKVQEAKIHRFLHLINMVPCKKKERDMGLKKSHFFRMIRIDLWIKKRFLKKEDIHNKLHLMSNAKAKGKVKI